MNNWCKLEYIMMGAHKAPITELEFKDVLMIIDDALDMGFEFKVENNSIYYREVKIKIF